MILSNDTTTRSCEVQLGWTAHSDIFYYTVFINGENISEVINNGNQSLILRSYPVCNCAVRQVSVIGVDRCGQQGQTALTTIIQLDQESIPPPTCETETTTQSTIFRNDENKYRSMMIIARIKFWRGSWEELGIGSTITTTKYWKFGTAFSIIIMRVGTFGGYQ